MAMAVKVQLSDGVELLVHVTLEQMEDAYQKALASNRLLQIESAGGKTRAVNPHQILYFEDDAAPAPPANGAAGGNGSLAEPQTRDPAATPTGAGR